MTQDQTFQTAMFFNVTLQDNLESVRTGYDDIPDEKQELLAGMEDGPLVKPVSFISFDYPYHKEQRHYFKDNQPKTKHELFDRILKEMPEYLAAHPYSAPHNITDFVIESIIVHPFNDWYSEAYVSLGS